MARLRADHADLALFDAHTHVGRNDPDGYKQTPAELIDGLTPIDARALTFPMHEPGGYDDGVYNDEAIAAAAGSDDRVFALCRVDPNTGAAALAEATRALDAGARGIKLHPRGESFTMGHETVEKLVALAHERELPMLIHAGRGIPALGVDTVRLAGAFPNAKFILAHSAVSDLGWIWREMHTHRNLYVDTSWWNPSDLLALFALAPPGQVLWASDSPYGIPIGSAIWHLRTALQAGLTEEQLLGIAGGQLARIIAGEPPADLGPPPGVGRALHPLLERIHSHLNTTVGRVFARADYAETLSLAMLACDVPDDDEVAPVCAAVREFLELFVAEWAPPRPGRGFPDALRFLIMAVFVVRTPDVPLP
ncbi:MAG: uncharacterized protein QOF76_3553 [Solirubrobacteraceae bacterium]|nr:uncharacterized protein [Solirubrobacteraceae bacterium]